MFNMRRIKKWMFAAILICGFAMVLVSCVGKSDDPVSTSPVKPETVKPIDYSKKSSWYQIPKITKEYDTFYILATEYVVSSMEEGAPDYAPIGCPEMMEKAPGEYEAHASVYQDATNVFVPYYRQAGLKYAGKVAKETGNIDAAISGMPYDDIAAALDYYFKNYNQGRPFIIAGHSRVLL